MVWASADAARCWIAGQGQITAPGVIGATPIEGPIDVEEGLPVEVPLVYYYGHVTPSQNPELYKHLVQCLAKLLEKRNSMNVEVSICHCLHAWDVDCDAELTA